MFEGQQRLIRSHHRASQAAFSGPEPTPLLVHPPWLSYTQPQAFKFILLSAVGSTTEVLPLPYNASFCSHCNLCERLTASVMGSSPSLPRELAPASLGQHAFKEQCLRTF